MSEQEVFDQLKYRIEVGKDGTRLYYNTAGQLHRTDGPAVEYADGSKTWYINGEGLSEEEFIQSVRLMHAGYTPAITTLLDNGLPNYRNR